MKGFIIGVLTLVICIPIAVSALSNIQLDGLPAAASGPKARINFIPGSKITPSVWEALEIDAQPHEVHLARVQVAPDETVWMIMAAPRRFDVHIPRRDLAIVDHTGSLIQEVPSCDPTALGSFRTRDHWDIRCADDTILRYDGSRYGRTF